MRAESASVHISNNFGIPIFFIVLMWSNLILANEIFEEQLREYSMRWVNIWEEGKVSCHGKWESSVTFISGPNNQIIQLDKQFLPKTRPGRPARVVFPIEVGHIFLRFRDDTAFGLMPLLKHLQVGSVIDTGMSMKSQVHEYLEQVYRNRKIDQETLEVIAFPHLSVEHVGSVLNSMKTELNFKSANLYRVSVLQSRMRTACVLYEEVRDRNLYVLALYGPVWPDVEENIDLYNNPRLDIGSCGAFYRDLISKVRLGDEDGQTYYSPANICRRE